MQLLFSFIFRSEFSCWFCPAGKYKYVKRFCNILCLPRAERHRLVTVIPPTAKQINTALAQLVTDLCATKASKFGVANYM